MKALPYLAGLAARHAGAERAHAWLHADIAEARLAARARSAERAARVRRRLLDGTSGRLGVRGRRRPGTPGCLRAAARSAHAAAGGAR